MPLVNRDIRRLADSPAGMVQPLRHIGQLHEFLKIRDGGVAAASVGVAHEGRTIDWGENEGLAADFDIAVAIAGDLCKPGRRGRTQFARQPARNSDSLAFNLGPRLFPALQSFRTINEIDADFFQNRFGVVLDNLERFLVQNLEIRNITLDKSGGFDCARCAFGTAGGSATTSGTTGGSCWLIQVT